MPSNADMSDSNGSVPGASVNTRLWRAKSDNDLTEASDSLAAEEPLEIRIRGNSVAVTMRTPGHDAELAAGFLLTEGIVRQRADIVEIAHCQQGEAEDRDNILNVFLAPSVEFDLEKLTRHVFASSSCGLCGKASIEAVRQCFAPVETGCQINPAVIRSLPDKLRKRQAAFDQTGGLHAAGLFDLDGTLLVAREDVGRHNAVDKAVGGRFLAGESMTESVLLVSGRASFEIMQKALAAHIPIVAAVSAPSSLAAEFAEENGQTLIGFLRGETFNVYSHPERIAPKEGRHSCRPVPAGDT